jgi:hypothetical protein
VHARELLKFQKKMIDDSKKRSWTRELKEKRKPGDVKVLLRFFSAEQANS